MKREFLSFLTLASALVIVSSLISASEAVADSCTIGKSKNYTCSDGSNTYSYSDPGCSASCEHAGESAACSAASCLSNGGTNPSQCHCVTSDETEAKCESNYNKMTTALKGLQAKEDSIKTIAALQTDFSPIAKLVPAKPSLPATPTTDSCGVGNLGDFTCSDATNTYSYKDSGCSAGCDKNNETSICTKAACSNGYSTQSNCTCKPSSTIWTPCQVNLDKVTKAVTDLTTKEKAMTLAQLKSGVNDLVNLVAPPPAAPQGASPTDNQGQPSQPTETDGHAR